VTYPGRSPRHDSDIGRTLRNGALNEKLEFGEILESWRNGKSVSGGIFFAALFLSAHCIGAGVGAGAVGWLLRALQLLREDYSTAPLRLVIPAASVRGGWSAGVLSKL
jgi:hypothetical protein